MQAVRHLKVVGPASEKRTVTLPVRKPNSEYRTHEFLTGYEVENLIKAAKDNRYGDRDSTMVLVAYRHGLRVSELVDLRWDQVDLNAAILHVRRVKQGSPATHPLTGVELRALRKLQRDQEIKSPFVFISERGTPFSKRGFQAMVDRAARVAGFDMKIHPHMLRHSCGYKLANDGVDTRTIQAYLGHKSIQHTVRYTELAPTRFRSSISGLEDHSPVARCRACATLRAEGARGFPWIVELIGFAKAADTVHRCPALLDGEESAV